jgi:hypothetical protein
LERGDSSPVCSLGENRIWSAAIHRRFFSRSDSKGKSGDESPHSKMPFESKGKSGNESPHSQMPFSGGANWASAHDPAGRGCWRRRRK